MGVPGDPADRHHGKIAFGVNASIHLNLLYGMPTGELFPGAGNVWASDYYLIFLPYVSKNQTSLTQRLNISQILKTDCLVNIEA